MILQKLFYKQLTKPLTILGRKIANISNEYDKKFDPKLLTGLKRVFKGKGHMWKDGYTCIKTECPFCNGSVGKVIGKTVYINKTTGSFMCPRCQLTQPFTVLLALDDPNLVGNLKNVKCVIEDHKRSLLAQAFVNSAGSEVPEGVLKKILGVEADITTQQIAALGIMFNAEKNCLIFPLHNSEHTTIGEKIINIDSPEVESIRPEDCRSGLLARRSSKDDGKAILVLNVCDFLALISQKQITSSVICLPHGLRLLPQECLPALEIYSEIILWFDFDVAGWDSAYNFAKKLNEKRCLLIRPTVEQPTPADALKKHLNLKAVLQKAQPILHKSITTFSSLRQDVLCELQNIEKVNGVKWKRFPVLNKLLKGHRKGELTIITGNTGCGKTTFMSEYSLDLAMQGVSTLWGSFEVRNTRLALTLLRQYVGYPLDEKLQEFDRWADEVEKLPLYFMTFHGQQNIRVVMDAIEHAQYVYDVQHVIIDNVQFMLGMTLSKQLDKFYEQDALISAFRSFATKHNVHVTLVMHPRKERDSEDLTTSSIFGSAKASQEADNVLIIQDKRLTSVRGKKYLQIAKNRYTGDLGVMSMEFNKDALSYAHQPKKK